MSTKIYFEEYGGPEGLKVGEESLATPGEGEVQVSYRAIAVNPVDWQLAAGYLRQWVPLDLPVVPGNDAAGVVKAVGPGVSRFAVGDELIWNGFTGGYRAAANVPAAQLTAIPAGLDFEQAACIPVAGGTAYSALKQLGVGEGDTVLIHAAAGGVGSAAVQMARDLGTRVIGTASEANHEYLRGLGAEPVTYGDGLVDRVRALGEVTAVLDAVGGEASVTATQELLPDLSRAVTTVADEHSMGAGIAAVQQLDTRVADVAGMAADGKLTFNIYERLPLTEAARAFEISQGGHVRGKIVLIP
ncbi:NADP-dependent oxidoreductase [Micrococcaceae bacterium Sec5.7]